jgi:hemolysin activation/secretion protein
MSRQQYLISSFVVLGVAVSAGAVSAQSPHPLNIAREVENTIRQQQAAQQEREDQLREEQRNAGSSSAPAVAGPDPFAPAPGGPCFEIRDVILTGFEAFKRKPEGYQNLIGSCATAAEIGAALNSINAHYQNLGYITTRAYVPEQDVADGSLEITIVPGHLEGYVYGNGTKADARIDAAFPGERGDLLNLRDLEQGLENINTPRSASGTFQLIPGEHPGGSFVQVDVKDTRPWHLDVELNNSGFDSTGVVKGSANFGYDNLFNLNDQLRFNVTTTPFESRSDKYSDSYSLNWSALFENWLFGLDAGYSQYFYIQEGINQSFPVEGNTRFATVFAERLLWRDQRSKLYAYGDLKRTRTRTYIDGFEIEIQRRDLSIASLGLRGSHNFEKSRLNWDVGGKFGLDILGAEVLEDSIVEPNFKLVKARVNYSRPIGPYGLTYRGLFSGHYSDDILPGTEQFSIGSWSTVRGFHDDSMYGDSGAFLRNSIEWDAYKGPAVSIRMNMGLDAGYVKPSELREWSQDNLVGLSFGTDVTFNNRATLNMQVAHALSRPESNPPNSQPAFEADQTIGYISFKIAL